MTEEPYSYIIVFTEPIDSTDVQFKELESLLRLSSYQLMDVRDYDRSKPGSTPPSFPSKNIVFRRNYKQSCILHTFAPPDLLHQIIKRSAYIHSCGLLVYTKSMDHSSITDIKAALSGFISKNNINSFELSFYTQDLFGDTAGKQNRLLIDQKRFFLGELPFDQVQKHFEDWKGPGQIEYRTKNNINKKNESIDARIWGYTDVIVQDEITSCWEYPEKRDEINIVIYRPLYRLKNPLYSIDAAKEAKPYWKGIDTTPQQLMGAMLNLAQVQSGQSILEPFAHTGSLIHEAAKLELKEIVYNDIFETIGAKDNLDILTAPPEDILATVNELKKLIELKDKVDSAPSCSDIKNLVRESLQWQQDKPYPEVTSVEILMRNHKWLNDANLRFLFYIIRRFFIERRIGNQLNQNVERTLVHGEFRKEGELLAALEYFIIEKLDKLKKYAEDRIAIGNEHPSRGLTDVGYKPVSQKRCRYLKDGENVDIKHGIPLEDNSIDAVVTDPPYGYGSSQEQDEISQLYKCFFKEAFRVVKSGGNITMCVLDKVRTGKEVRSDLMTEGVVSLANNIAKENHVSFLVDSIRPFSRDTRFLSYWKAQYKLNRGILSFRIAK